MVSGAAAATCFERGFTERKGYPRLPRFDLPAKLKKRPLHKKTAAFLTGCSAVKGHMGFAHRDTHVNLIGRVWRTKRIIPRHPF